ncbi:MAG: hypothetical protein KA479_00265 [Saprospiraceae bacterium]|jgi:hypothetical protein|nr:hypothetical protein [Saprospiraceae bacterium]
MKTWSIKRSMGVPQEMADYILRNLPFFGFLASLVVIYIYVVHQGQGRVREYQAMKKEVKELRWQYLTTRSDLMVSSQQSALAKEVEDLASSSSGSIPVIIKMP